MCKYSNICVHPNDICDGIVQCIDYEDDELLCEMSNCPNKCICLGYAAKCVGPHMQDLNGFVRHLKVFFLTQVLIDDIHNILSRCFQLIILDLSGCIFVNVHIGQDLFRGLTNLHELSLKDTNIKYIAAGSFQFLNHLKTIHLSGCKLDHLKSHGFMGLRKVNFLQISKLHISTIDDMSFCNMSEMRLLNLSHNLITSINMGSFTCLLNLMILDLTGNPIVHIDRGSLNTVASHFHVSNKVICCYAAPHQKCETTSKHAGNEGTYCGRILTNAHYLKIMIVCFSLMICLLNLDIKQIIHGRMARKDKLYVYNLAIGNGLICVYILTLLIIDWVYSNDVLRLFHDLKLLCRFITPLPFTSIVVTRSEVFLISLKHFIEIRHRFSQLHTQVNVNSIEKLLQLFNWVLSLTVGITLSYVSNENHRTCFMPFSMAIGHAYFYLSLVWLVFYTGILLILMSLIYFSIIKYTVRTRMAVSTSNYKFIRKLQTRVAIMLSCDLLLWFVDIAVMCISFLAPHAEPIIQDTLLVILLSISPIITPCIYVMTPTRKS